MEGIESLRNACYLLSQVINAEASCRRRRLPHYRVPFRTGSECLSKALKGLSAKQGQIFPRPSLQDRLCGRQCSRFSFLMSALRR